MTEGTRRPWPPAGRTGAAAVRAFLALLAALAAPSAHVLPATGSYTGRDSSASAASACDVWSPLAAEGAPSPRKRHSAVWTGTEMLVWGGSPGGAPVGDGAAYNAITDSWRPLALAGAPSPRYGQAAVWTGAEMLIWGGSQDTADVDSGMRGDGAAYDPVADSWRPLALEGAPDPRLHHTAVWTGTEMLVWGGANLDLRRYGPRGDGVAYNPATDTWRRLAAEDAPSPRFGHSAVWTGRTMLVWGGTRSATGADDYADGAAYDPVADAWTPLTLVGNPGARYGHAAAWTGASMVIWGGSRGWTGLQDGALYDSATDRWKPLAAAGAPAASADLAVWDGAEVLVGGFEHGAAYQPGSDTWRALPTTNAPAPRTGGGAPRTHPDEAAVWTGAELIVWGGAAPGRFALGLGDGARYTPPCPRALVQAP